jgi:hypothetical protein
MRALVMCVLVAICVKGCTMAVSIITKPPSNVTTTVFSKAIFTCEGQGTAVQWSIEGSNVLYYPKLLFEDVTQTGTDNVTRSKLTVVAIPLYNKTSLTITCLMVLLSPFHSKREAAQLTIQGIDGVVNITLNQSTLSWSPPPSVMPRYHDKLIYVIQVYTMYNHSYHTTNSTMMELPESALSCYATINVTLTVTSHGFTSKPITETLTYKCPLMSHTAESTYSTASDAFNKLQSITTTTEDPMIVGMSIGTSHSLMTSNVMSLTSHGTSAETPVTFESNNPTDVSKGNK